MLKIKQFRFAADNLAYLVYGFRDALVIDGGAVEPILAFLKENDLNLRFVTNSHRHADHTPGNEKLLKQTDARFIDSFELALGDGILRLGTQKIQVIHTPGHSYYAVVFALPGALITGDTLFNGTVGNCFTGDLTAFFNSIKILLQFPPDTRIYAGHDYLVESVAFARKLEPTNVALETYLAGYDPSHVVSTLADELAVNPYLRINEPTILQMLQTKGLPHEPESERWKSMILM